LGALAAFCFLSTGCVRSYATRVLADALSGSGGVYGSDEDPELVAQAVPFGLKTMEGVLQEQPTHKGLLLALSSGFVQYAFAFVEQPADEIAETDIDRALAMRRRAKKLYLRAKSYGMRGLESAHPGIWEAYAKDKDGALKMTNKGDVPLLYWTAAAWGLAISASKDDPEVIADFPEVAKLASRALELDESWNRGALHEFFISFETASPQGSIKRAREHYERAIELSEGTRVGPFVSLAERVSVKEQNAREFHRLIQKALAIDPDKSPDDRLANVIMQRRARRIEKASGDLFLEDTEATETSSTTKGRP
jgi:tetratricopeptide (TPR) repeat protein